MLSEFDLIRTYFTHRAGSRPDVLLGIGDDTALCRPPAATDLAIAVDTLVAGVHFPHQTTPADLAYKALAVNLSDLAAMGAQPAWFTLSLTLPQADPIWLRGFSAGLFELADAVGILLIGGDTSRGPLSVSVHVTGWLPQGQALRRSGARPGDAVYVTGCLGDAGLGLSCALGDAPARLPESARQYSLGRLNRPTPRLAEGRALLGLAHSAIDVSDGLLADLGHILQASGVGAELHLEQMPLSAALRTLEPDAAWPLVLSAGDDYELCFSVPPQREAELAGLPGVFTRIGQIVATPGLRCYYQGQAWQPPPTRGYQHFQGE